MIRRNLIFLAFLAVLLGACTEPRFGAALSEHPVEVRYGWQYRWGDSPRNEAGEPLWSFEDAPGVWTSQTFGDWPKGSKGEMNLWQRVRLPGFSGDQNVLFVRGAWQLFEAYVGGRKIYSYGDLGESGRDRFPGQAWHWIPMKPEYSSKMVTFRFYSSDRYFGVYDGVQIGTRQDHLLWILKRDLALIVLSFIYMFIGLTTIFIYTRNRGEYVNLSFGLFSVLMGIYELSRTYVKQLILFDPMFWGHLELTAFFLVPFAFCWFAEHLIGAGPFKIFRRIWQASLIFVAFVYVAFIFFQRPFWSNLLYFQYAFMGSAVVVVGVVCHAAYKGHPEARLFVGGVIAVVLAGIHDVLVSIGAIRGSGFVNHIGMYLLVMSLALIIGRRYFMTVAIRKNLELASAVQNLLLPKQKEGTFGMFQFASYYHPHGRMSGDWLNFWKTPAGEQRLVFGDVIGKGPRAALAVAAIAAFIENAKEADDDLEALIHRVNTGLGKLFGGHITSTLSAASLHADGNVQIYNCGGVGWIRAGAKVEYVPMPSSALGMEPRPQIAKRSFELGPGECVFAFTDGVLEGTRAITKLVRALNDKKRGNELTLDQIFETATAVGVASQIAADDRSILAVKRVA